MGALTATTPKPLLALAERPIIEHILRALPRAGIDEAVIVTGYRGAQIEACLGDGRRLGLRLCYRQQTEPRGTARALLAARDRVEGQVFLLSWGDVVVEPGTYAELVADFGRTPCDALLTVNDMDDPWRGAAVYVDADWRVTQLIEKPPPSTSVTRWNNAGIFIFTPVVFDYSERLSASPRGEYELPQAIGAMITDGRYVRAHPVRGFWSDLGTPEDLVAAEAVLADRACT